MKGQLTRWNDSYGGSCPSIRGAKAIDQSIENVGGEVVFID
jgi:hypothetical protein